MKILFMSFILSLAIFNSAHALDQGSIDILIQHGMQVKMGELTGAGSKFSLHNLAGLILPDGVLMKEDCTAIVVKPTADPKVSDIVKIKVQNHDIAASEFIGFVIK